MTTTTAVQSFEDSVNAWPTLYEDVNQGRDLARWQKQCISLFAPAALFGQELKRITIGPVVEPDDRIVLSFPCFRDDDPALESAAGNGGKVKFRGKTTMTVMAVSERCLFVLSELSGAVAPHAVPLAQVTVVNRLAFKLSMMSMTSAGPGFEILGTDNDGSPMRLVFRIAVDTRDGDGFERTLRDALGLASAT